MCTVGIALRPISITSGKVAGQLAADTDAAPEALSDAERDRRINLARSILGHAPDLTPVRRALMALEGASAYEICEARGTKAVAADGHELAVWQDGWEQGRDQRCVQCQATYGDGTAA